MSDRSPTEAPQGVASPDGQPVEASAPRSTIRLCPYLLSADGDWRATVPTREHRCTAVDPAVTPSVDKQRRLCLAPDHVTCSTYLAARRSLIPGDAEADTEDGGRAAPADARPSMRWVVPMSAPIVIDRGRPSARAILGQRSVAQLGLVVLMALAFLVLALARLTAGASSADRPVVSPAAGATTPGSPTVGPEGTPTAGTPAASSPTSPAAGSALPTTAVASTAPGPAATRTYRVVAGDTLTGIAARFGVTVKALQQANGISDPSLIRVGSVLVIP